MVITGATAFTTFGQRSLVTTWATALVKQPSANILVI